VTLPGWGTVMVDVDFSKSLPSVGYVASLAFRKANPHVPPPNSSKVRYVVGGEERKAAHVMLGTRLDVLVRAKGGSSVVSAAMVSALACVPTMLKTLFKDIATEVAVEEAAGAATDVIWASWTLLEVDEEKQHRQKQLYVDVLGNKKALQYQDRISVAEAVMRTHGIPAITLGKLQADMGGKIVAWDTEASGDIGVRAKLRGGASISRSERIMNKILNTQGVQESSRGAMWAQLDPFHDHPFRADGWPDAVNAASVVECFKQTFSFGPPSGVTTNWDVSVVLFPSMLLDNLSLYQTQSYSGSRQSNVYVEGANPVVTSIGGCTVFGASTGGGTPLTSAYTSLAGIPTTGSGSLANVPAVPGAFRVFGWAMEIVNQTAPLYQQGSCTVWRQPMPSPLEATSITVLDSAGRVAIGSALVAPGPPNSVAEAMLLQGSRQWHAKEGAYVIATVNSDENYLLNNQSVSTVYYEDSQGDQNKFGVSTTDTTSAIGGFPLTVLIPFNMSGAYFTNLSNQTSLTVNLRTFVEIFPSQLGNPLTSLAQPSAPYDELCLRIISECLKDMPPGVMLCENGFGDWLSDVVGKVASFVSPIAGVVSKVAGAIGTVFPAARGVAMIADQVGGVAGQLMPGSAQLRDDGVAAAITRERKMIASERKAFAKLAKTPRGEEYPVKPKSSAALRQQIAMDKIRLKGANKRK